MTLLDAATRKPIGVFSGHADVVRAVAFSKDGKRLAAGGGVAGPQRRSQDLGHRSEDSDLDNRRA